MDRRSPAGRGGSKRGGDDGRRHGRDEGRIGPAGALISAAAATLGGLQMGGARRPAEAVRTRPMAARSPGRGVRAASVPFNHSELEPGRYGVFVAVPPA